MSAIVSLNGLFWSTPDGTTLFNNLQLSFARERTGLVGRNGTGKSTLLRLITGEIKPAAGAVQLRGSMAMLRQDVTLHRDATIADLFNSRCALDLLERAENGLADADELADADWTLPARIEMALARCDLAATAQTPLSSLSGGQRSRAALAALLVADADSLLLDEPTNNLDRAGRKAVLDIVTSWTGGVIIASHDRELLEEIDAIVELTSLGATRYGGNYSDYQQQKAAEISAAVRGLAHAEKTRDETDRRAQLAAERKARKDGAGHRARAKGDQPKILMDAARGRAEASGGASNRLRDARRMAADEELAGAREKIEILQPVCMDIAPTGLPAGKQVLRLENVTAGYNPGQAVISNLSLSITGPERVVIAGPNGSGKSTLLKLITGQIMPQSGVRHCKVPFALLDQHVEQLNRVQSLLDNFLSLNAGANQHMAHEALARFGFRAADALRLAGDSSGGERVRAALACALGGLPPPSLLILDEPTNHLDLEGIAALEAALAAYDGAVLVVSHDAGFIQSLGPHRRMELPE
ncbi:ABC-F family ATP-binding cassette domain-containing protein [Aureimonas fodinaquatilis]|uniref:ABC-F family ATP-binding cassette domain-containing protein n=1 Tax=Aureimonas fodinaquatilis TaxID=2565783 RepID=A0A5B0DZU2_9HYPH|nr:ABC-F family ATP-binding cassette domain-containing protein [Aureimonas fodinaquatilis]KAA0972314.1 ABC-F family ATP-binding cassette domain-containing protein [Aureimonas fodinaquatilis]